MQIFHIYRKRNINFRQNNNTIYIFHLKKQYTPDCLYLSYFPFANACSSYTSPILSHHTVFPGQPVNGF